VARKTGSLEGVGVSKFWLDRPTFVTGATGLVGGWLVRRLVDVGADVVCLVRDWVPQCELVRARLVKQVRIVWGDVREQALLERTLGEYEIDTVIHLAAQTIVSIANRNPVSTFETNIGGTWALLEAARRSPMVKQIIVASSDKAYGEHDRLPYTEEMPLCGCHPYDVSKSCVDLIAQAYAVTYGLPVVISRCGNFYGGGDLNWNRVVPGTIRSAIRGQRPIIRSDGRYVRDYFYVEDAAEGIVLATERYNKAEPVNLGAGFEISIKELVGLICELAGFDGEIEWDTSKPDGQPRRRLDTSKAKAEFGFEAKTDFREGLRRTIEWYGGEKVRLKHSTDRSRSNAW